MLSVKIWIAVILPLIAFAIGCGWFIVHGVVWQDIATFLIFYQIALFGISVCSHRFFAHKSFKAPVWFESILFFFASSPFQYSPLYWAAVHRKHHQFSDRNGDPHSPWVNEKGHFLGRFKGWLHAHFLWIYHVDMDKTAKQYAPDLLAKSHMRTLHRRHKIFGTSWILLAGVTEALLLGEAYGFWRGVFWGGLFRIVVLHNAIFTLGSLGGHGLGTKAFDTKDQSTNCGWLFVLMLGECWHNNHHASPTAASPSARWWQLDPHFWVINIFKRLGWVSEVKEFATLKSEGILTVKEAVEKERAS